MDAEEPKKFMEPETIIILLNKIIICWYIYFMKLLFLKKSVRPHRLSCLHKQKNMSM